MININTYFDAVHSLVGGGIDGPTDGPISEMVLMDGQTPPTEVEIQAEITRLESLEPQRLLNIGSLQYLASTDWYVTRHAETGVAVPADVTTARAAAREAIV